MPSLSSDDESKVPKATTRLADERVVHYWDAEGRLRKAYRDVMKWEEPAWDVYFVYGRNAEWKNSEPPIPDYWMHQLHGLSAERFLKGNKLAEEVKKQLASK